MRSQQVYSTLLQGNSRFEVCRLVAEGVRMTHRSGTRMNESIGDVMEIMAGNAASHKSAGTIILEKRSAALVASPFMGAGVHEAKM